MEVILQLLVIIDESRTVNVILPKAFSRVDDLPGDVGYLPRFLLDQKYKDTPKRKKNCPEFAPSCSHRGQGERPAHQEFPLVVLLWSRDHRGRNHASLGQEAERTRRQGRTPHR